MKKNTKFLTSALESRCDRILRGSSTPKIPTLSYRGKEQKIPSLMTTDQFVGSSAKKTYTGDALLGIAVSHKSNLIPVFNTDSAKDLASMRR